MAEPYQCMIVGCTFVGTVPEYVTHLRTHTPEQQRELWHDIAWLFDSPDSPIDPDVVDWDRLL